MNKISDAELEIMKILWQKGGMTSPEIVEILFQKNDWEKTTIKTLLARLVKKGCVEQAKTDGKLYFYKPSITEREYKKVENENFITKLYQGSVKHMLLNFVEEKQISKGDLEKLIEIIEQEEQRKGK